MQPHTSCMWPPSHGIAGASTSSATGSQSHGAGSGEEVVSIPNTVKSRVASSAKPDSFTRFRATRGNPKVCFCFFLDRSARLTEQLESEFVRRLRYLIPVKPWVSSGIDSLSALGMAGTLPAKGRWESRATSFSVKLARLSQLPNKGP